VIHSYSVLVNTRNEEQNIRSCLSAIPVHHEIIVVDMESEDLTVEIAKSYTSKVFTHKNLGYADPARSFALSKATKDWVLIVDADEIVDPRLWVELDNVVEKNTWDVVEVPFRTWMFGREILGGGWGPGQDWHERFFRRSMNILSDKVHQMFEVPKSARVLKLPFPGPCILHFNYLDLEHFLEKYNRYTTIEAQNNFDGIKPGIHTFGQGLFKATKTFIRRFLVLRGYRDGGLGFLLALLMTNYSLVVWFKEVTMNRFSAREPRESIRALYERLKSDDSSFTSNIE